MRTAAIVPAAGLGTRLGAAVPKALVELAGQPLLLHAVRRLWASSVVDLVVVAAPAPDSAVRRALSELPDVPVRVVRGGAIRRESVAAALAALPAEVSTVLVHDAARPLAPVDLVRRVASAVADGAEAVVPVLAVPDTVKQVQGEVVVCTLDRERLRLVQTPQGFRRDVLGRAHAEAVGDASDDAGLVEALGVTVVTVPGAPEAFKVTSTFDLAVAEAVVRGGDA